MAGVAGIVFVGAGNVASCLADVINSGERKVQCVFSRTEQSASALAGKLGCAYVTRMSDIPGAEIYITMLRDDALLSLAPDIVKANPDALFLHTSGSVPMTIWQKAGAAHYGVLYPLQTFSKGKKIDWQSVPFFVEASSDADMTTIQQIASSISSNVRILDSEQRSRMHLAAVFTCNFTNRMYAISELLLKECGLPFSYFLPLVRETALKVSDASPGQVQTGPAVRGDSRVMQVHRQLLSNHPQWQELYDAISADIMNSIRKDG